MSRIGKLQIAIPAGVEVKRDEKSNIVTVKGPKGELTETMHPMMKIEVEGAEVKVVCEIMPYSGGLTRNIVQCLDDFGIPLLLSHTISKIYGKERITGTGGVHYLARQDGEQPFLRRVATIDALAA